MAEEYIYERERDLLDYIRNNLTDPLDDTSEQRATDVTETHTATAAQTEFVLNHPLAKNVADTITVNAVTKCKGYDYTVSYGEGKQGNTKVTLKTGALVGEAVVITYRYGQSLVEREYSRSDAKLPRVVMMFLTGEEDFAALGDLMESTRGSYFNVSYRIEVRTKYANQGRELASKAFNLFRKLRQENMYRTNITRAGSIQNFDYDTEKEAYVWQFTGDLQWEIMYE